MERTLEKEKGKPHREDGELLPGTGKSTLCSHICEKVKILKEVNPSCWHKGRSKGNKRKKLPENHLALEEQSPQWSS